MKTETVAPKLFASSRRSARGLVVTGALLLVGYALGGAALIHGYQADARAAAAVPSTRPAA